MYFRGHSEGWGSEAGGEIRQRPPIHRMYFRGHSEGWGSEAGGDIRQRPPHRKCIREAVRRGEGPRLET